MDDNDDMQLLYYCRWAWSHSRYAAVTVSERRSGPADSAIQMYSRSQKSLGLRGV
jgi:hypothetical protein